MEIGYFWWISALYRGTHTGTAAVETLARSAVSTFGFGLDEKSRFLISIWSSVRKKKQGFMFFFVPFQEVTLGFLQHQLLSLHRGGRGVKGQTSFSSTPPPPSHVPLPEMSGSTSSKQTQVWHQTCAPSKCGDIGYNGLQ